MVIGYGNFLNHFVKEGELGKQPLTDPSLERTLTFPAIPGMSKLHELPDKVIYC